MASGEREYWIAGGRDEIKSLQDLQVFVLVPRSEVPRGQRPLKGKLVCKRKRDETGKIVRYKVRYMAKGFAQRYGIDYDKTTAPTVRLESFRTILHSDLRARRGQEAYHMAQLFGSCGRDYSGTELIPEAFNVLGSCQPTSHGKPRPHRHIHTM